MNNTKLTTTLRILVLSIFFTLTSTMAIGQSFVLDVQYNPMSFTNDARTVISDPGRDGGISENAKHRYDNVITVNGVTVYAHLTLLEVKYADIRNFDDDSQTGDKKRFQPRIGSTKNNKDCYVRYQLEFFNAANDAPVFLYNYWVTGVDIDGSDSKNGYREFVEVSGYTSYQVDQNTMLTVTSDNNNGTTRFEGRKGSLSGVTFDNTASFIANYANANNKITFTLGITEEKVTERYFSIQLGAPDSDGPFDKPVIVTNPLPVAIDDIGIPVNTYTGGVSVSNVLDNDLFDGAAIVPSQVNISLISGASHSGVKLNTSTGQVNVDSGTPIGTYYLTYKICMKDDADACDLANVTVEVVQLKADIEIVKTASKEEIKPGETFTYTISVTNNGPGAAQTVKVQDVLPWAVDFISASPSSGNWDAPQWNIGTLSSGATETLTLTVKSKTTAAGNIVNTATASTATQESNYQNNTSNKTVVVIPLRADVEVVKTASKESIKPGETFNYTISVENKGPDAAYEVKVQDILPNSLDLVEADPSIGTWNAPNWTIGTLASGITKTMTLTVSAKSSAAGNIVNTATVSTTTVESNYQNNTSNKTVQVTPLKADVEVVKTASKESIVPGETFNYTISVENKGPDAAYEVKVRDVLPSSLTFVEADPSIGTWNAPNWTIGTLASGVTKTLTLTVTAKSNAAGNIVNTATVSTTTVESNYQNNTSNKTVQVSLLSADLEVTKTASKNPVKPGETFTYTITLKNNGPNTAANVIVEDVLPSSLNLVEVNPSEGTWNAPNWSVGNLSNGATKTLSMTVSVKSDASGNIVNTAKATSTTSDTNSENNTATKTVQVSDLSADLALTKTASKNPVEPGETFIYTLSVKNNGPDAAEEVKVRDILPNSLDFVEATPSTGTWTAPDWTIGTLASGVTKTINLTVKVKEIASGSIVNTATVTSTTADPDIENNSSTKVVPIEIVELSADLEITKTASKNVVNPGESFIYVITVKNNGPDAASAVKVRDLLPSSLNLNEVNPSVGTWSAPDWTIGNLANGATKTLSLSVSVKADASGSITNTAVVSSTTPDPDSENNSSTKTISVEDPDDIVNHFPASGYGTLAFEDLWPGKGDYDFNDLVLDYQFEIITNTNNKVDRVKGTFIIKAFGATLENGFGFQLSDNISASDLSVSGYSLTENFIRLSGNGTESRQTKPTIIVYDNAFNQMAHPGIGTGVNTEPSAPYVTPDTIQIIIDFPANKYSYNDLDISNFNPFLIVNLDRSMEVHLPDYPPTDLADRSHFKTFADNTNPSAGIYYKTENNLPWAIHIYENFAYPSEKKDIMWSHLKFVEWASSGGTSFSDWYQDKAGYRNNSNIYQPPF